MAAVFGLSILGGISAGHLADKWSMKYLLILLFLLQAVGITILWKATSTIMLLMFIVPFGLSMTAPYTLSTLLLVRCFGKSSSGAIYGTLWALEAIAFAIGPPLTGHIFDVTGSYAAAFIIFITSTILALVLVSFIRVPAREHF
jgi:cyanate permease